MPERKIIPAHVTIKSLREKAAKLDEQAKREPEPLRSKLKREARECRQWIISLRSGKWHA